MQVIDAAVDHSHAHVPAGVSHALHCRCADVGDRIGQDELVFHDRVNRNNRRIGSQGGQDGGIHLKHYCVQRPPGSPQDFDTRIQAGSQADNTRLLGIDARQLIPLDGQVEPFNSFLGNRDLSQADDHLPQPLG
jgi:hypothetical protein